LPSEAVRELEEDPTNLALRIIPMRRFEQAFRYKDKPVKERPEGLRGTIDEVNAIELEIKAKELGIGGAVEDE